MTLVLAAAVALGAPGHVASGYGLLFAAPARWHARIYERSGGAPIIQVADARLGAIDGDDLALSTQRRLRPGRILIVVLESRPVRTLIARWRKTYPAVRLPIAVHRVAGPFEGQQAPAAACGCSGRRDASSS
ncbi:MAG TPA: hypothetical protein VE269_04350 [Gaiellaceae bacterium]|nr:hypothetical protein [Gaiellaceae bacterium]